jgi:glucose 1-dehydrogenase
MVNNAGVEAHSVLDTTEEQYDRVMDINLKSAFFGTQIAARQMIKQGGGAALSTSARCTRTGRCRATPRTA